jgi:hypothetical protein
VLNPVCPSGLVDERWLGPVRGLIADIRHHLLSQPQGPEGEAKLEVLALRWRCLVGLAGEGLARTDPDLRKGYALLVRAAEALRAPRPAALDPNVRRDWVSDLSAALEILDGFEAEARARADRASAAAILFDDLRSLPTRYVLPEDEEGLRLLRRGVAHLAGYLPLREELARFALPYRDALGEGFAFLWKEKRGREEEGTKSGHLTRRQILKRMLGRMISKHIIGAVHAPVEKILRGFPPHQAGQAKEALDELCSAGLIVRKFTNYGERVFLDPGPLGTVKAFLAGGTFGISSLDRWATSDSDKEAA